jgi:hypothetical protein
MKVCNPGREEKSLITAKYSKYGYIRVQVAPKDYDTAKKVLSGSGPDA